MDAVGLQVCEAGDCLPSVWSNNCFIFFSNNTDYRFIKRQKISVILYCRLIRLSSIAAMRLSVIEFAKFSVKMNCRIVYSSSLAVFMLCVVKFGNVTEIILTSSKFIVVSANLCIVKYL